MKSKGIIILILNAITKTHLQTDWFVRDFIESLQDFRQTNYN